MGAMVGAMVGVMAGAIVGTGPWVATVVVGTGSIVSDVGGWEVVIDSCG